MAEKETQITNTVNRRRQKRWKLMRYLSVYDAETDSHLGRIIDLHTQGMMLISHNPIPPGQQIECKIEVPVNHEKSGFIRIKAESVWNNRDINPDYHDTGFKLIGNKKSTDRALSIVIDRLRFSDYS